MVLTTASWEEQLLRSSFGKVFMGAAGSGGPSDDEFNRVSFLSHFEGSNNGVNNAFDDASASNHTISAQGSATQGSYGPFARPEGEWGWNFDGNGDSLTFTNDATMSLDGDYTFELFFNARTLIQDTQHPNTFLSGTTQLYIHSSSKYISWYANSGNIVHSANNSILTNVWNHVAVVRSGTGSNNTSMYLNGTRVQQYQNTATLGAGSGTARIGSYSAGGGNFDGQISNLRILKGTALYSGSSITVPTAPLTAVSNTKLLTCQSNRFVDNSSTGFAITPVGNTAVTAFGPFLTSAVYDAAVNGASAYFDGSGDFLRVSDTASLRIGTAQYTIECWFWFDVLTSSNSGIFAKRDDASNYWRILATSSGVNFRVNSDIVSNSTAVNKHCWNHIAITRDSSNNNRIYVNGVLTQTISSSVNISTTGTVRLGEFQANSGPMTGYICDARIVIGTAVYTGSSLTPPTAPLTAVTNTKLLLNMANGQAIDSAAQNNLTLYGNAKISTGQAKFGNTSMVFDGTGDYVTLPSSSFKPFGTGDFTIECFARFDAINGKGLFQLGASYLPSAVTGPAVFASVATNNPWRIYYGTSEADASVSPSANTWYHVAYVRSSGVTKLYVDGTSVISQSDTTDYTNTFFVIGGGYSSSFLMDGYIDEFRTSHMARYTSNFTAPTAAFADKGQDA